ncbi:MAG: dTMP kinase [Campylobacterales bacterium]
MYIAIEGVDTAGKSTQIALLAKRYPEAIITREPGGSPIGSAIREMVLHDPSITPRGRFLLFLADRAEHIERVIKPNQDKLLICDRSLISGIAYADSEISDDEAIRMNLFATGGVVPDLVILLKLTPEELSKRLANKQHDAIEAQGINKLLAIQERLEKACRRLGLPCLVIDASRPAEDISLDIQRFIHG